MKTSSSHWEEGVPLSPFPRTRAACSTCGQAEKKNRDTTRNPELPVQFPAGGKAKRKSPTVVHFLHLHSNPATYKITKSVHQHLQSETSKPSGHFQVDMESGFVTLSSAKDHKCGAYPDLTILVDKRIQVQGTGIDQAFRELLTGLLEYTGRRPMTLTDLPAQTPKQFLVECLLQRHWIYLVLEPHEAQLCQASLLIKSLPKNLRRNIRPILVEESYKTPGHFGILEERIGCRVRHHIRTRADNLHIPKGSSHLNERHGRYAGQIRRVAREIGCCRIGLALSSGGAKGFAHVGVIQVLEELGIEIDIVAGSSFGAVVGALWARGYDGAQLQGIATRFRNWMHLLGIIDHAVDVRRGLIRGKSLQKYLRKLLGSTCFNQLSLPLAVTATDLETLQSTIFEDGDVASALHASCAIPGICIPCKHEERRYIDGGVANPLPVRTLKDMGIEHVIAVSTVLTGQRGIEIGLHRRNAMETFKKNHPVAHFLNKRLNLFAHGNAFDTLMRSIEAAHFRLVELDLQAADLVLRPLPYDSNWKEMIHPDKYVKAGWETASSRIDAILELEKTRRKEASQ